MVFLKVRRGKGAKFRRVPVSQRLRRDLTRYVNRERPDGADGHHLLDARGRAVKVVSDAPDRPRSSKLSGAPAPPQPDPRSSQNESARLPQTGSRHRRPLGTSDVDLHVRLPAGLRTRLPDLRRERGLSMSAAVADLVRRGLEEPPPRPLRSELAEARPGLVREAGLACLMAIEQTRIHVESALPLPDGDAEDVTARAALAAEDRLAAARIVLGDWQP